MSLLQGHAAVDVEVGDVLAGPGEVGEHLAVGELVAAPLGLLVMVLNMLTTGAMVLLGKTYGNAMVDVNATNDKLRARACRIVRQITGVSSEQADELLRQCNGEVKTSLVVQRRQVSPQEARRLLAAAGGRVREALESGAAE